MIKHLIISLPFLLVSSISNSAQIHANFSGTISNIMTGSYSYDGNPFEVSLTLQDSMAVSSESSLSTGETRYSIRNTSSLTFSPNGYGSSAYTGQYLYIYDDRVNSNGEIYDALHIRGTHFTGCESTCLDPEASLYFSINSDWFSSSSLLSAFELPDALAVQSINFSASDDEPLWSGTVDSYVVQPVPLPPAGLLFITSIIGMGIVSIRGSKRSYKNSSTSNA